MSTSLGGKLYSMKKTKQKLFLSLHGATHKYYLKDERLDVTIPN